ncbi:unnamed protein product [Hermetia illucens]|uniref:J domain-containing protein n=1 Tax=Hermetia illucens TaxID=343691 RepID=A0A7R8UXQ7_HERIL|nr:dnaJ homolog subfamily C member 11 [Hermetia illucens]CAD7089065.1 unnamed protein product [Hermetia illucens]
MEDDSDDGFNVEENYYAFLNVPKNAGIEDINSAYRHLSRMYHPDKHLDDESKRKAEILFNRTKKAYEVLSDPHKRAIYDSLGVKGLQTEGWEIVHRQKTPAEIREEYERLAREREERKLLQRTNPKGHITINFNATDIFDSYDDSFEESMLPSIEISGMSIAQSIEAPLTVRDTVTMSGNLSSHNGNGNGGFLISGRRLINKGWLELDIGGGYGPLIGFKGSRTLSQKVYLNGGASLNFRQNGIIPGIMGTLAVQLDKHTVGYLTFNGGLQSSMSTVVEHNTEKHYWNTTILLGIPHCYLSASYTRKLAEHELKLRMAGKVGTFGFVAEYGAEKKVSKYSSVVASVSLGVPTGVTLKIKIIRSSQTFIFPIHLSEEIVPAAVFYATVTPLLTWFVLKKTIIEPMNAEQRKRDIDKVKETHRQRMAEKKKEAETAVDLMKATCERIVNEEERKKGLIIVNARYGKFPGTSTTTESGDHEITIDVTIPIQCLVRDSRLILHNSTKSELPGFYDPCFGEDKQLKIEYIYRENPQEVTINDNEAIRLPVLHNTSTPASSPT